MAVQVSNSKLKLAQQPAERCLNKMQTERLSRVRPGDEVRCTRGILWITQEGDFEDHLVHQGEKYIFSKRGAAVVQALTDSACYFSKN